MYKISYSIIPLDISSGFEDKEVGIKGRVTYAVASTVVPRFFK